MSASTEAWLMVAFMVLIGIGVAVVAAVRDREARRDDDALATPANGSAAAAPRRGPAQQPRIVYTHAAPARPFIVPDAHRVMRDHLECTVADCPRKREAHATLVAAGKIVPRRTAHTIRGRAHVG